VFWPSLELGRKRLDKQLRLAKKVNNHPRHGLAACDGSDLVNGFLDWFLMGVRCHYYVCTPPRFSESFMSLFRSSTLAEVDKLGGNFHNFTPVAFLFPQKLQHKTRRGSSEENLHSLWGNKYPAGQRLTWAIDRWSPIPPSIQVHSHLNFNFKLNETNRRNNIKIACEKNEIKSKLCA